MILAIETTSPRAEVAVVEGEEVVAALLFRHRMDAARMLMPRIDATLQMAGVALPALAGIAVSLGPGSYTGIRIGVVTAKLLAAATGVKLVGVPTLEALAAQADALPSLGESDRLICALIPARADEYFAGLYQRSGGELCLRAAASVLTLDALVERLARYPGEVLLAGDARAAAARLGAALGPRALIPRSAPGPLAPWVARLGERRLAEGHSDDPATLAPLYVRAAGVTVKA
jgi:tRNA threonylcarbamoyladenosine biosynthesis protein TsaB